MYYKLDNNEFERIKEAEEITFTDYEMIGNFIPIESMMCVIEDLLCEIGTLEEKYNDLTQDLEDNYKLISKTEMYGISDKDFI